MISRLHTLSSCSKRLIAVLADYATCTAAFEVAIALRLQQFAPRVLEHQAAVACYFGLYLVSARVTGVHRQVLRNTTWASYASLARTFCIYLILAGGLTAIAALPGVPRTAGIIHAFVFFSGVAGSRLLGSHLLFPHEHHGRGTGHAKVLIYGASHEGALVEGVLRQTMRVVAFVDNDATLWRRSLNGIPIHGPEHIEDLVNRFDIAQVVVMPAALARSQRLELAERLQKQGVTVRIFPDMSLTSPDGVDLGRLHTIEIGDVLGRASVSPDQALMAHAISGRSVLVTGAGGSIGSELCRQIIQHGPVQLLLLDHSELLLYEIHKELEPLARASGSDLIPLLGSVCDENRIRSILEKFRPQIVFHAAAYKHVPLVEHNCLEGIINNVFGTLVIAREAEQCGVETFVLVSTDKAVRPTNVMGCTKRVAELILQGLASETDSTCFCMVRFGNVLGSSGSVVPLFRQQIDRGGPVTITHRDMTRYFMTIPEAAQLIIQAGALAEPGNVFLLNMGEPVRILDLARNMVRLSGLSVRDETNPSGDIEIVEVGIRPGEKLYEELLISADARPTPHPLIYKGSESSLPWELLQRRLSELDRCVNERDEEGARAILRDIVPEYAPGSLPRTRTADRESLRAMTGALVLPFPGLRPAGAQA